MKKITLQLALLSIVLLLGSFITVKAQTAPVVDSVATIIGITRTTAFSGCWVSSDGGAAITEKGICVSTSSNPTIADLKFTAYKISTPAFEPCVMSGLTANTHYYVRAYATNSVGTSYSATQKEFTTSANDVEVIWPCSTDFVALTSGNVSAANIAIDKLISGAAAWNQQGNTSVVAGEIQWPTPTGWSKLTSSALTLATFSNAVYFNFSVTSTSGAFRINKMVLSALGYKTGSMKIKIASSLDNFTTADTLTSSRYNDATRLLSTITTTNGTGLSTANPVVTTTMGKENIEFYPNVLVPAGQTVNFRVYVWGKAGSSILLKNLIVSGTTDLGTGVLPIKSEKGQLDLKYSNNQLRIENAKDIRQLDIFSANGKLLQSIINISSEIVIGTTDFQHGVYIIKAQTDAGIQSGKFIK